MAGLADPPGLGLNSWFEGSWARAQAAAGPRFIVENFSSWRPTAHSLADRTISIAPGGGWHCGVWDQTDAPETVQLPPNNTNVARWDIIVSRVDWSTGTRTFTYIQGGSTIPTFNPTMSIIEGQVSRAPGLRYDGVVAAVRLEPGVGRLTADDVADLRVWGGSGALMVASWPTGRLLALVDVPTGSLLQVPTGQMAAYQANQMVVFEDRSATLIPLASNPSAPVFSRFTRLNGVGPEGFTRNDGVEDSLVALDVPDPGGFAYRIEAEAIARTFASGCECSVRIRVGNGVQDPNLPILTRAGNVNNDVGLDVVTPKRISGTLLGRSRIIVYVVRIGDSGSWAVTDGSIQYRVIPA